MSLGPIARAVTLATAHGRDASPYSVACALAAHAAARGRLAPTMMSDLLERTARAMPRPMFQATIYRTSAVCGIQGRPARTIGRAYLNARTKAGPDFIHGRGASGEAFGYDASEFLQLAEAQCRRDMRGAARISYRDCRSDMTLELVRIDPAPPAEYANAYDERLAP